MIQASPGSHVGLGGKCSRLVLLIHVTGILGAVFRHADVADLMDSYPYSFYIALDGNGINGLEGMAGICLFHYDPTKDRYAFKIVYFPGISAGHAVSINPQTSLGYLGNAGQHLLFFDAASLEEVERMSTLRFEVADTSIRGSTHLVWLNDREFITAIGDFFYRFDLNDLSRGERLGPHLVKLPHAMKLTASGRYLVYGSMDHPQYGEAREVGIWDMKTGQASRLQLPATCWHVIAHPKEDWFYAVSFRVLPQENVDYHEWAMAFLKEYAFEIDASAVQVRRHWSCGRETPAHINSDITISERELIFCNGGSQSIMFIDLEHFADFDFIDEKPTANEQLQNSRQVATQVYDVFARGSFFNSTRHFFGAMRVSRFSLIDSVHACQLSQDQKLLFTANRGLNHITVYDYPSKRLRLRVPMPPLQEYVPHISKFADPRLGFHHSCVVST